MQVFKKDRHEVESLLGRVSEYLVPDSREDSKLDVSERSEPGCSSGGDRVSFAEQNENTLGQAI